MKRILLSILLVPSLLGCTSLRSTALNRAEDDSLTGNSNGKPKWLGMTRPYHGVPITIKVPTHVDVKVIEISYLYDTGKGLEEFRLSTPHREVEIVPIETEKVFTVDFKRPISGSLKYSATLGDDQYFDAISGKLVDTTITDVANLVGGITSLAGAKSLAAIDPKTTIGKELIVNKRVIAYQRFDIDACDFEEQVRGFLETHLNCGHTCHGHDRSQITVGDTSIEPLDTGREVRLPQRELTPPTSKQNADPGGAAEPEPQR